MNNRQKGSNYSIWFEIGEVLPGDGGTKTVFSTGNALEVLKEFETLDQHKHFIDVWVVDLNEADSIPVPTTIIGPKRRKDD